MRSANRTFATPSRSTLDQPPAIACLAPQLFGQCGKKHTPWLYVKHHNIVRFYEFACAFRTKGAIYIQCRCQPAASFAIGVKSKAAIRGVQTTCPGKRICNRQKKYLPLAKSIHARTVACNYTKRDSVVRTIRQLSTHYGYM